ncbi:hypothetical protein ACFLV7_08255 [Chloroflexota bacterium]
MTKIETKQQIELMAMMSPVKAERYIQTRMHKHFGTVEVCVKCVPAIPTEASEIPRFLGSEVEWNDLL